MKPSFHLIWLPLCFTFSMGAPASAPTTTVFNGRSLTSTVAIKEQETEIHIIKVATVNLATNNPKGCTLTVSSGQVTKAGGASIEFQVMTVPVDAPTPEAGDFKIASGSPYTISTAVAGSSDHDLYVKYIPSATQDSGTYTASLFLQITDNA